MNPLSMTLPNLRSIAQATHGAILVTICLCFISLISLTPTFAQNIDFRKQIQPILSEHCWQCHGVDESTREGNLRLDLRESAIAGGESSKLAIVAGKASESEMIRRILSDDPDHMMPPPSLQKPLSKEQIELLQGWIDQGAQYDKHWAFIPPSRSQVDLSQPVHGRKVNHAIDWLVADTLHKKGWPSTAQAKPWELCRRVYLDLIGIPPTPQQIEAFQAEGLAATVEKLLADDRFAEKWARPWLDVARYSDTNGYEKDLQRDQWAWRDWVLDAIAKDMPYDQFIIEQIAGDLLPNPTQEQIIATGFLRNSMINEEGAIVPEQFRMVEMFDRIDCIGKGILGMSLQCAQCHTHKFDPITHDEYYGMFAFLNNTFESRSWVYTPEQLTLIKEIRDGVALALSQYKEAHPDWETNFQAWKQQVLASRPKWRALRAELLETVSGLNHPVQESDDSILMVGHSSNDIFMIAPATLPVITGIQFEVLTHGELPFRGPGRSNVGMFDLREIELFVQKPGSSEWEKQKFSAASADFSNPEEKSADGKNSSGPVANLIDGKDETVWKSDRGLGRRNQSSVVVLQLEKPIENLQDHKLKIVWRQGEMIGCCRISVTDTPTPSAHAIDHDAILSMIESPEISLKAFQAWMATREDAKDQSLAIENHWKRFPSAKTSVLHMSERDARKARVTYTLKRGIWDQPDRPTEPQLLSSFHPPVQTPEPARLRLARWLVDKQNPLTSRVAVNRVWQEIFGQGLVETSEDFGTRAPVPEYQGILDTLAVEFMDSNWSLKKLVRSIVLSDTYQRSSHATNMMLELDPKNRWLTRGPRFRCDAETVRDMVLSISGLMHHKLGGPSVIPPVPQNVLDYNYVYPGYWKAAEGPERYRRALYMFRKRSMPDPVLSSFDAPNGDAACARRIRSNTPLAALTGLNEPIFVEAANGFAMRILRESPASDVERIEKAYKLATSRSASDEEKKQLIKFLEQQRKRLADGWLNPREILTGDPGKLKDLPEGTTPQDAAAWTLAARVLLNLDETLSKQ
ncbi:MAG: PSD1 and planctomycete cytochrome C domain-containing protein [Planctomycetaceae bacterium]|nr:PSD1 and planctomycete cytochrome C domain-containing protein [Planctomycetaceae bacterium]MCE2811524.1 PSD1 and planctomycete cytochrome C domain-containing protein [Planctomycetaceae bacterium]